MRSTCASQRIARPRARRGRASASAIRRMPAPRERPAEAVAEQLQQKPERAAARRSSAAARSAAPSRPATRSRGGRRRRGPGRAPRPSRACGAPSPGRRDAGRAPAARPARRAGAARGSSRPASGHRAAAAPSPLPARARARAAQRRGGRVDVAVQRDRRPVLERVRHARWADDPADAVALELELAHRRRGDRHRHERRAVVVDEAGQRAPDRRRGAAGPRRVLEHGDVEAGGGEMHGRDETVVASADDDHAGHRTPLPVPRASGVDPAGGSHPRDRGQDRARRWRARARRR